MCPELPPPLWPHQQRGLAELWQAIKEGERAVCLTSPTGGGKTRMAAEIIKRAKDDSKRVVLYTNRRLLVRQTHGVLDSMRIDHGIMAAGWDEALLRDVQVASMQTIESRVLRSQRWNLHEAHYVIVDEAHLQKARTAQEILRQHQETGAVVIGFTATPIELGHIYKKLIVAGTNSELRACGALVPCDTYGPDEPDLRHIGVDKLEYTVNEQRGAIMRRRIFGRVYENWVRLNPDGRPTILFAPGVRESRWFARMFNRRGVTAAHIDAETPDEERQGIIKGSREGKIKVICNRFVCREGVDFPWLEHMILACVMGRLSSFLQAGGRLLRAHPGVEKVVLQDHGGHWWRHGSLNDDRAWQLEDTDQTLKDRRKRRLQTGEAKEPMCCPRCGKILRPSDRFWFDGCPACGHRFKKSVRVVVQVNGTLKRMTGDVVQKKRQRSDAERTAYGVFYQALNSGMTVAQMEGYHYRQTHRPFPNGVVRIRGDTHVTLPERNSIDWNRRVRDVFPVAGRNRKGTG